MNETGNRPISCQKARHKTRWNARAKPAAPRLKKAGRRILMCTKDAYRQKASAYAMVQAQAFAGAKGLLINFTLLKLSRMASAFCLLPLFQT